MDSLFHGLEVMRELPSLTRREEVVVVLGGQDRRHLVGYLRQEAVRPIEDVTGRENVEGHNRIPLRWVMLTHNRDPRAPQGRADAVTSSPTQRRPLLRG